MTDRHSCRNRESRRIEGKAAIIIDTDYEVSSVTGCWEWKWTSHSNGYGRCRINGRTVYAHRVAYAFWIGPIPEGLDVLHRCDNPRCVNPQHLFLGTAVDNALDMVAKGRNNGFKKLNAEKVRIIKQVMSRQKLGDQLALAHQFGVSPRTIRNIMAGDTWNWVKP